MSGVNNIKCCTKGYTNQLKLCPTTEDYQQADSPPQPAQGPRSTNGAGGLNPKPLNWVANEKNFPVPCFHSTLSLHSPIHRISINRYTWPSSLTTRVYMSFPGFHTRGQPHKNNWATVTQCTTISQCNLEDQWSSRQSQQFHCFIVYQWSVIHQFQLCWLQLFMHMNLCWICDVHMKWLENCRCDECNGVCLKPSMNSYNRNIEDDVYCYNTAPVSTIM